MDITMGDVRSIGTQTGKRQRTDAEDGAEEVGSGLAVTKPPRGIPHNYNNNFTVRLTYSDTYLHNVTYGQTNVQVFHTNSIYDPDVTNTGHQPFFRDMWASQYDYYAVLSCDYEIDLYNAGVGSITYTTSGSTSQRIGSVVSHILRTTDYNDFITNTEVFPIAEMKNVSSRMITPEDHIRYTGTLTPGDFIVDAKDANADTTWTAVGSNPAVARYVGYVLNFAQKSALTGQNTQPHSAIQAFVKLHYTVQFTQISPSLRRVPS